mmetsp:Transcript_23919/g.27550  ORF Transcript_23919/g.27550 Transcript_23919/m.27550 type:complete len:82 (+) Transcript_23919:97-342(+)
MPRERSLVGVGANLTRQHNLQRRARIYIVDTISSFFRTREVQNVATLHLFLYTEYRKLETNDPKLDYPILDDDDRVTYKDN